MSVNRYILGVTALAVTLAAGACSRESGPATAENAETGVSAPGPQVADADEARDRQDELAQLSDRVAELEREYAENSQEVASGARTATAGLREELREDVTNVKQAVNDLGSTTPENWWDRHEQAIARTADDIAADVQRLAGTLPAARAERPAGTTGIASGAAGFEGRRDAFVSEMRARLDAMEQALERVEARGAKETELQDTEARVDKLRDDIDRLRSASADDWWDLSKARVTEYVDRVEDSVDRLDDDRPADGARSSR